MIIARTEGRTVCHQVICINIGDRANQFAVNLIDYRRSTADVVKPSCMFFSEVPVIRIGAGGIIDN